MSVTAEIGIDIEIELLGVGLRAARALGYGLWSVRGVSGGWE